MRDKKIVWLSETLPDRRITAQFGKEIRALDERIKDAQMVLSRMEIRLKDKEVDGIEAEMVIGFLKNFGSYFAEWDTRKRNENAG